MSPAQTDTHHKQRMASFTLLAGSASITQSKYLNVQFHQLQMNACVLYPSGFFVLGLFITAQQLAEKSTHWWLYVKERQMKRKLLSYRIGCVVLLEGTETHTHARARTCARTRGPSLSWRLSSFSSTSACCAREDDGFPEGLKNDILIKSIKGEARCKRERGTEQRFFGFFFFQRDGWGRNFIHLWPPSAEEMS